MEVLRGRPLLPAAVAFAAGVVAWSPAHPRVPAALALCAAAAAVALRRRAPLAARLLVVGAFAASGGAAAAARAAPSEGITAALGGLSREAVLVEGRVVRAPERGPEGGRLVLAVDGVARRPGLPLIPASGTVRLRWKAPARCAAEAGERVRAMAALRAPGPALSPFSPDGVALAAREGVALEGALAPDVPCAVIAPWEGGLRTVGERARGSLHRAIDRALPPARAALVRAFATGDRSAVTPEVARDFQASGLAHLLAVSGLNLAIVCGSLAAALDRLFRRVPPIALGPGARRTAAAIAIPAGAAYALLVGGAPSAVRAAIMAAAVLGADLVRRRRDHWTALAAASTGILAFDPLALSDPAFQLSFAAVAGLLVLGGPLAEALTRGRLRAWPWWRRWPAEVVIATLAATLATAPILAATFGRVSLVGLLANLPAAPLGSIVLVPLALAGAVVAAVAPPLGAPLLVAAGWAAELLAALAHGAASVPGATVDAPRPLLVVAISTALVALLARGGTRRLLLAAACACAVVALAPRGGGGALVAAFLPVGQGDAAVVECPDGTVVVIDAGPEGEDGGPARRIVAAYLASRGKDHVDLLVLSHPHADHAGGLGALSSLLPIREVWWTGDRREAEPHVLAPLDRLEATVPALGATRACGGARLEVLAPIAAPEAYAKVNDGSLVVKVTLGSRAILFAGDAEREAEEAMLAAGAALHADVLKVGHHGSRTSSSERFLDAVRPSVAILSLGPNNRFGFPHAPVVERLAARGVRALRTDRHGMVVVETDGEALEVRPFRAVGP